MSADDTRTRVFGMYQYRNAKTPDTSKYGVSLLVATNTGPTISFFRRYWTTS